MNEEIRKIGTTSGIETFEGINTYKEGYEIKLVIKYEDESGRIYEIESEKIEVEKEACEHEYDNECDEECNRCGEKREAPHLLHSFGFSYVASSQSCPNASPSVFPHLLHLFASSQLASSHLCGASLF